MMTTLLLNIHLALPYFLAQSQSSSSASGGASGSFFSIYVLAAYLFTAYCLMKIYDKLGEPNSWFAWIPILNNLIMYKAGGQSPWWVIGLFIPIVNIVAIVFLLIAFVNVVKRLGKNPWLILLTILPLVNFWVMYHFAFN